MLSLHLVFQGVRRRLLLWGKGSLRQVGDGGCRGSACLGEGKARDREPNSSPHSCYSWECVGFMGKWVFLWMHRATLHRTCRVQCSHTCVLITSSFGGTGPNTSFFFWSSGWKYGSPTQMVQQCSCRSCKPWAQHLFCWCSLLRTQLKCTGKVPVSQVEPSQWWQDSKSWVMLFKTDLAKHSFTMQILILKFL